MNDILNEILPETYKKGYFYNSLTDKDKVISFLRSVININYENCMNTIETNKQSNRFCYDEIKNLHKRGNVNIDNMKLYDFFEEKCYYRNKLLTEDCQHKGFFLISKTKDKFIRYLKNDLNFSIKTINEIDKYIDPIQIKKVKKIKSSIVKSSISSVDTPKNSSYITQTINSSYKTPLHPLIEKRKKHKSKSKVTSLREEDDEEKKEDDEDEEDDDDEEEEIIPDVKTSKKHTSTTKVKSSRVTTTRKHIPTSKISNWGEYEELTIPYLKFKKKRSAKIISKKLRENPQLLLTYNLHKICSNSGYCIAFGKKTDLIKKLFENFNNSEFIKSITTLASGGSGEVLQVLFERYKYQAYTILKLIVEDKIKPKDKIKPEDKTKTKKISNPDNLAYEYIVGKFLINKYYKKFPCFLETYGFIFNPQIKDIKNDKSIFDIMNINISDITQLLTFGCENPKNLGLVIEYVKNPKTLLDKLDDNLFWYKDLLNVLFQVYYTLFLMRNIFTHYDLHGNNVLVFEPKKDHYIQYHYHYRGKVISFKSIYLVKIIDYGRCGFVNNMDNIKSSDIHNMLCNIDKCIETNAGPCGVRKGFIISSVEDESYITPIKINNSHDLRLLHIIGLLFNDKVYEPTKYLREFNKTNTFGTPEDNNSGLTRNLITSSINNIMDAFIILKELIQMPYIITKNENYYKDFTKLGDLHIYDDGKDMVFNEI
jgi:hypothetical protein